MEKVDGDAQEALTPSETKWETLFDGPVGVGILVAAQAWPQSWPGEGKAICLGKAQRMDSKAASLALIIVASFFPWSCSDLQVSEIA